MLKAIDQDGNEISIIQNDEYRTPAQQITKLTKDVAKMLDATTSQSIRIMHLEKENAALRTYKTRARKAHRSLQNAYVRLLCDHERLVLKQSTE